MRYKTSEELAFIEQSALLLSKTHGEVSKQIKPGVTTNFLDKIATEYIRDNKGTPSFLGYDNFPSSLCISVNNEVVHGIPSYRVLRDGDVVSIDCGVKLNRYHSDSAYTYPVGEVGDDILHFLKVSRDCLLKA